LILTQRCTRRYILVIETRNDLKRSHLAREIVETIALTLIIFLVIRFAIQSYRVEGVSMQPGLQSDQYVLVNKMAYLFHAPERGDVIVFHFPLDTSKDFIKRVIGLPGDTISYTSTMVQVNGVVLNEPYISEKANPLGKNPFVVPPNEYFVMGDNRPASDDSRDWGYVPKDYIVGKAVMVYWPLNKWQLISTYPTVFGQIKSNH
jgi:signal peptidase I